MEEMKPRPEKPLGLAIIVCERVIQEAGTGNKTIVSTFNNILTRKFPCRHARLAVYVALTNGNGESNVSLVFRKSDGAPILRMRGKVNFANPNHVVELIFNLLNCVFPEPGLYVFEILVEDEYIFESRFNVLTKEEQ